MNTNLGTPCAGSWDAEWVEVVDARESLYGRRMCGARTLAGSPCTLSSSHSSGRCRYHGGFNLTGAPEGNRNGVIHGLYSRRLMPCGPHCPVWQSCPLTSSPTLSSGERKNRQKETVAADSYGAETYGGAGVSPAGDDAGAGPRPAHKREATEPGGSSSTSTDAANVEVGPPNDDSCSSPFPSWEGPGEEGMESDRPHLSSSIEGEGISGLQSARASTFKPNPNIEYHSWGFGGLRKQANDASSDYAAEVLRLPQAERPICPYEQVEYNAAVTDALQLVGQSRISAYGRHVAHMLALAQVMMGRAGLALRQGPMTEAMEVRGENYNMTTSKVSAALTAYQILERSWRRLLADFGRHYYATDRWEDVEAYELRIQNDTSPTFSLGERKSRQEETITAPSRGVNSNAGVGGSPAEEDVGAGPRPAHEREAAADSGDSHLRGIDIGGGTGSCAFADEEDLVPAGRAAHREGRPPNGEP